MSAGSPWRDPQRQAEARVGVAAARARLGPRWDRDLGLYVCPCGVTALKLSIIEQHRIDECEGENQ